MSGGPARSVASVGNTALRASVVLCTGARAAAPTAEAGNEHVATQLEMPAALQQPSSVPGDANIPQSDPTCGAA